MRVLLLGSLLFLPSFGLAESPNNAASASASPPAPVKSSSSPKARSPATTAQLQAALDQLAQANRDLLDLLKKQQAVLEDIQFDRRQQSRHLESLEERLTESQLQNAQLQNKVANLEADAAVRPPTPAGPQTVATPAASTNASGATVPKMPSLTNSTEAAVAPTPPAPPETYLPAPESEGAPGTMSWHRLFTLKGNEAQQTDLFPVRGRIWRVLWHNQDQPGKIYENTSALFINAFPKDDTIPQKVCAKLGSGGDSTELQGPGNYYLKIEASGGSWEIAVEDFR